MQSTLLPRRSSTSPGHSLAISWTKWRFMGRKSQSGSLRSWEKFHLTNFRRNMVEAGIGRHFHFNEQFYSFLSGIFIESGIYVQYSTPVPAWSLCFYSFCCSPVVKIFGCVGINYNFTRISTWLILIGIISRSDLFENLVPLAIATFFNVQMPKTVQGLYLIDKLSPVPPFSLLLSQGCCTTPPFQPRRS